MWACGVEFDRLPSAAAWSPRMFATLPRLCAIGVLLCNTVALADMRLDQARRALSAPTTQRTSCFSPARTIGPGL